MFYCFAIVEADIVIGDERAQHKKIPLKYVSEQKAYQVVTQKSAFCKKGEESYFSRNFATSQRAE